MGNAAQAIFTVGLIGGVTYLIARSRQQKAQQLVTPAAYTVTTTRNNGGGLRASLLGGLGGALVENSGGKGRGLLDIIFGGKGQVGSPSPVPNASTPTQPTPRSTSPAPITGFGQQPTGARLKRDLMRDFGFTSNQAAGIVGNLHLESAGFQTLQEIQPMEWQNGVLVPSSKNRGGYGYAQWTGPRRRAFEAWATRNSLNITSYAANYGFLRYEMTKTGERRVVGRLKATSTVADATTVFMRTYLRPGISNITTRISFARRYA